MPVEASRLTVSCAPASWLAAAGESERMSRGSDIVEVCGCAARGGRG